MLSILVKLRSRLFGDLEVKIEESYVPWVKYITLERVIYKLSNIILIFPREEWARNSRNCSFHINLNAMDYILNLILEEPRSMSSFHTS